MRLADGGTGSGGFGLVEVLVALVLLSAGMLGVARLAATVAERTTRSSWETGQTLVAQQVLDSIRQAGHADATSGRDTLRASGRRWPVSWAVRPVADGLKEVRVRVEGVRTLEELEVSTRIHRPVPLSDGRQRSLLGGPLPGVAPGTPGGVG